MEAYLSAIILMGGEGKRLSSVTPKQFHHLGSLLVYQHTLHTFRKSHLFQEIILVCHPDWVSTVEKETSSYSDVKLVQGGATRQASSLKGLQACHPSCQYVMIHDAVRPFVSLEILKKNAQAVLKFSAVDTCIPSSDTLVTTHDGHFISSIPPRCEFRRGQTPQTFAYPLIYEAHQKTARTDASDDCQLLLDQRIPIALVEGSEENFKITTEWDLIIAKNFLESR
jgi:ribitol-5-phosphate 2-dehydrogenase (NADP+) / D-ribitol-5-phosphate cytidylyltransferase